MQTTEAVSPLLHMHVDAEAMHVLSEVDADRIPWWIEENAERLKRDGRFELFVIYFLGGFRASLHLGPSALSQWRRVYWQMDLQKAQALGDPLPPDATLTLYRGVLAAQAYPLPGFYWSPNLRTAAGYANIRESWTNLASPARSFIFRTTVRTCDVALYIARGEVVCAPEKAEQLPLGQQWSLFNRESYGFATLAERRLAFIADFRRKREAKKRAADAERSRKFHEAQAREHFERVKRERPHLAGVLRLDHFL